MPDETKTPNLVTLSMGAIVLLAQMIAQTNWTNSPKEKINAGRLKGSLEPHLLSQPDGCALPTNDPAFVPAAQAAGRALREWRKKTATLELTEGQRIAFISCVKFNANQTGGADEFSAELQAAAGITE